MKSKKLIVIICFLILSNSYFLHNKNECEKKLNIQQKQIIDYKNKNTKLETQVKDIKLKTDKEIKDLKSINNNLKLNNEKLKKDRLSRGGGLSKETFVLTFYSSLNCENGYGAITCNGENLSQGMVANNVLPQGTKIHLENYGVVTVADRGGNNFNNKYRLDVFVPKNEEESDYEYLNRVNNMGRIRVKGHIVN